MRWTGFAAEVAITRTRGVDRADQSGRRGDARPARVRTGAGRSGSCADPRLSRSRRARRHPDRRLDGNAAAGPLAELFTVDLAAALARWVHCGKTAALAEHWLYADAPALVVRCPGRCGVVLRFATTGTEIRLDLTGARLLSIIRPTA